MLLCFGHCVHANTLHHLNSVCSEYVEMMEKTQHAHVLISYVCGNFEHDDVARSDGQKKHVWVDDGKEAKSLREACVCLRYAHAHVMCWGQIGNYDRRPRKKKKNQRVCVCVCTQCERDMKRNLSFAFILPAAPIEPFIHGILFMLHTCWPFLSSPFFSSFFFTIAQLNAFSVRKVRNQIAAIAHRRDGIGLAFK